MFGYTNGVVVFEEAEVRAEVIFFANAMDETGGFVYGNVCIYMNTIKTRILIKGPLIFIAMQRSSTD